MDDLIAFVTARLAEEEANAREALAQWPGTHFTIDPGSLVIVEFHRRYYPARALREVEAMRAVVAAYEKSVRMVGEGLSVSNRRLVLAFAAIWSDHPDFRPEWKP